MARRRPVAEPVAVVRDARVSFAGPGKSDTELRRAIAEHRGARRHPGPHRRRLSALDILARRLHLRRRAAQKRSFVTEGELRFSRSDRAFYQKVLIGTDKEQMLHAIAADQLDSSAYMWFFAWWPDAIGDGFGAIHTEHVFVPEGYNLAWTTAMPGPSLLLAPLTLAAGPLATAARIRGTGPNTSDPCTSSPAGSGAGNWMYALPDCPIR